MNTKKTSATMVLKAQRRGLPEDEGKVNRSNAAGSTRDMT